MDGSIRSKVIRGSQNFEIWSRDPKPRPLWGHFMTQTQYGPVLYICAKFEADISIRSKVIRGSQNFELVFAFYICCFVLVNKHIIYL